MINTNSSTPGLQFWNGETQTNVNIGTVTRDVWNHLAVVRINGVISVYINGVLSDSQVNTQNYANGLMGAGSNPYLAIGFDNGNSSIDSFHGYIDNVHVESAASYSGVPTTYEQPSSDTILLENFDTPSATTSGVIQYTSKTATSFEGCIVVNGDNAISIGSEIVPYSIS